MSRPPDDVLDRIRHAAFELREEDASLAVKELRRLLRDAGPAEPLVHGALGELLLEEFDDVDGALHHFGQLVKLAPDLPAGHIGLARSLAKNHDDRAALAEFAAAQRGFEKVFEEARATPDAEHPGLDEAVLTALELALEAREFHVEQSGVAGPRTADLDWAESTRLFDSEEEDTDDWVRYARLRATLEPEHGFETIERVATLAALPVERVRYLRSFVHEAAGRTAEAAREALEALGDLARAFDAGEVFRAAALLAEANDRPRATKLLEDFEERLVKELGRSGPEERAGLAELRQEVKGALEETRPKLVPLGARKP